MSDGLALALASIGAVKFGDYKLKSGMLSPLYLDLRILVSYPRVLRLAAQSYAGVLRNLEFQRIAAIPYAGLPLGTAVALEMDRPLIYPRREKKDYGTARAVEGLFERGETAVVLDDVITTGASKIEAIDPLTRAGLRVRDIVVLVDREQGGAEDLGSRGYHVHSVLKITDMMRQLKQAHQVSETDYVRVMEFLAK